MGELQRWAVTYTKHVHQKRKVYQDGVLEHDGSKNKISLYDVTDKLLDSRYLKKDEVVSSGVTFLFNSYLVDVGVCEDKRRPLSDSGVKVSVNKLNEKNHIKRPNALHSSSGIQSAVVHNIRGMPNHEVPNEDIKKEWDALYTTQITQKSKKYHDGILQLIGYGSHTKQVILLSEDRSILSSKYVKSVECLRTGDSIELPSYLVQIWEPRDLQGDQGMHNMSKDASVTISNARNIVAKKKHCKNKLLSNEVSKRSLLVENEGSGCSQVENIPSNREASRNRTFRNVSQILSGLQKAGESHGPVLSSVEQVQTSKLSVPLLLDAQNECKASALGITDFENPKMTTGLNFKVDDKSLSQISATPISTLKKIIKNKPDFQLEQRMDDSSPSSGLFPRSSPMASNSPRKYPGSSQPIEETLAMEAKRSEDSRLAINNLNAGSTTSIRVDAGDWLSNEKENLYALPSDVTDLGEANCGTTLIFSHREDARLDQDAALSSSGREEIDNMLPVDMPSCARSSYSVPATATPEPALVSSGMSKIEKLPDIPNFDLGI